MNANALKEEDFDVRLNETVEWALKGLDLDVDSLVSRVKSMYSEDMLEKEMTTVLMSTALSLATVKEPGWRIAASRFLLINMYDGAAKTRHYCKFGYENYLNFVKQACKKGYYDEALLDLYTEEELMEAATFLNPAYDLDFDYAGMNLLLNRYLIMNGNEVYELPQEAFLTIALWLASVEKNNRMELVRDIYNAVASRQISLATPILINLRRRKGNLSSCFISAISDSLESILYNVRTVGVISKNGGGVGLNLSRIRASGAVIANSPGASGGVIPWIKIINDTAVAVNQLGKRAGAVTVALDLWHLDIEHFLELQSENGDQRRKAYDVFPQVVVPDLFMERVTQDGDWTLVDPFEVREKFGVELAELWGKKFEEFYGELEKSDLLELKKVIKAKDLMKSIMKTTIETGMPYMFFKDTANINNPNKHDGYIGSGNLCQESFSNFRPSVVSKPKIDGEKVSQEVNDGLIHTCNLASINLANVHNDEELAKICSLIVRMLDNAIDLTTTPIGESSFHNNRYRTVGVGALGLADYLAARDLVYNKSANEVDELFEKIAYHCVKESVELAKERGAYTKFKGSEWSKGIAFGKDKEWFNKNSSMSSDWSKLLDELKENGIRNSQLMAVAPNTSSALVQGCTASVLPTYSKFYVDKNSKGAVPICPPYIKDKFWFYVENKNIDQREVVEVISRIQKWIDQGISFEMVFNLNSGITAKDMYDTFFKAWQKKCKTIYYIRTIQQDSTESEKKECISCAG